MGESLFLNLKVVLGILLKILHSIHILFFIFIFFHLFLLVGGYNIVVKGTEEESFLYGQWERIFQITQEPVIISSKGSF